ncbi:transcriptional regulator [Salmonella enterica subsp. enterica serovar Bredeney]|nr:transcriptional regulator [Salmonella enterica subsp. enterica serovar Bredeney]ECM3181874.1 transcriptional regulator [Salmonella enterica subsp. enterica serovar Newport]MDJ6542624.1 transcriptional regulator [Salmonella enterica]HAU3136267.1 transcriptional regulator [Salmonella enterica subsp. diarizonae]ECD3235388.1 transcriptional regulator [Salmonella enterica subsp. enterica serovar Bredeney]
MRPSDLLLDFVYDHEFSNPLQRLIMICILTYDLESGDGERRIDHDVLCHFCCCSKQAVFKETLKLEREGFLAVKKIARLTDDAKARMEDFRGYTITPPQGKL